MRSVESLKTDIEIDEAISATRHGIEGIITHNKQTRMRQDGNHTTMRQIVITPGTRKRTTISLRGNQLTWTFQLVDNRMTSSIT